MEHGARYTRRRVAWLPLGLLAWCAVAPFVMPAAAQETPPPPAARWTVWTDGVPEASLAPPGWPLDSLDVAADAALNTLRREGYYYAALDSVATRPGTSPPEAALFLRRGPRMLVGAVEIEGATLFEAEKLRALLDTRPGRPLDARVLESDVEALLVRYERAGRPLAQVRVAALDVVPGEPDRLALTLAVDEGAPLTLARVAVEGGDRTRGAYVARVAGLEPGRPLGAYEPDAIRKQLEDTGFFKRVGVPTLRLDPDGAAVLVVPVEEEAPGTFDLALGYLPPGAAGGSGSVVGNGHLELRNLFGGGRIAALKLNRLPGQVSSVDVRLADPFVAGWPFRAELGFAGRQQDSTYGQQAYRAELGYRFDGGLETFGSLSREVTKPGRGGVGLGLDGRQRIPRAEALFVGVGLRYQQVDRRVNPRRGWAVETTFERGTKERTSLLRTAEGDTTTERTSLRQERLQASVRAFLPTWKRQLVAVGGDAALLLSNAYDLSDLYRLGGASSLRGYNEDQFQGRFVQRAFVEYRYQLDRNSYAYVFTDLGYYERPALDAAPARRAWLPGYGLGLQVSTELGLVNASYAVSPDDGPANGRIHIGLSFGL